MRLMYLPTAAYFSLLLRVFTYYLWPIYVYRVMLSSSIGIDGGFDDAVGAIGEEGVGFLYAA